MDKQIASKFIFKNYNIDNIEFNINKNYSGDEEINLDVKFGTEIKISETNTAAEVKLSVLIFEKCQENNYPFKLSLDVIGNFTYEIKDEEIQQEKILNMCKLNGTTALFPYMRSAITDITKIANIDPLVLPLINIYSMLKVAEVEEE